jgi:hypothetical protein
MTATGKWNVVIESPLGQQRREMILEAGADTFTGSVTGPDGTNAIAGLIAGDKLTWSDKITSPMPLTLYFETTLAGDEMSGVVKLSVFGKAKFAATRVG